MTYPCRLPAAARCARVARRPAHLRWREVAPALDTEWSADSARRRAALLPGGVDARPCLACGWPDLLRGHRDRQQSGHGAADAEQTVSTDVDTCRLLCRRGRRCFPRRAIRVDVRWQGNDEWVLKPALGRVGEDVLIAGVTRAKDARRIARDVRRHPRTGSRSAVSWRRRCALATRIAIRASASIR